MARRSAWFLILPLAAAAVAAAVLAGTSLYKSAPASYGRVLSQYLKAWASGDPEAGESLVSPDFVNELAELKLSPGSFRAYDFGFQGAAAGESATLRFALVLSGGEKDAAYLADAVFRKKGLRVKLTAVRKVSEGKPLSE